MVFHTDKGVKDTASTLRGYIGNKFSEYMLLHNHTQSGFLNLYPKVQYRVIEGIPIIVGIGRESKKVLLEVEEKTDELKLGKNLYRISSTEIHTTKEAIRPNYKMLHYRFITPWLAFNPKNYRKYREIKSWKEKKEFLNRILVGNILAMCKGLGIVVDKRLYAHSHLDGEKVEYKGVPMLGFTGEFRVNFAIPDFFGLGKGVSQGWGVVKNAPLDR